MPRQRIGAPGALAHRRPDRRRDPAPGVSRETGFPEAVLERVQALPEVGVAVPVVEAVVGTGLAGQGNLLVLAVDMTGDRSLREYDFESGDEAVVDDPLVFLAQPDSLIVTREFAERNRLVTGSRIPMQTMVGEKQFTVRGIMRSGGLTSAFAATRSHGRLRRAGRLRPRPHLRSH